VRLLLKITRSMDTFGRVNIIRFSFVTPVLNDEEVITCLIKEFLVSWEKNANLYL
jgi:hypothetical protein